MIEPNKPSMVDRMIRAAKLDASLYEEVEGDKSATSQAFTVVAVVSLATAVGSAGVSFGGIVTGVIFGIVGWALWAAITLYVGTNFLGTPETKSDWGEMARTLGFAQSIGVLRIFGIIPFFGGFIFFVISILQLVAMVIAVKTALDYTSVGRAIGVVLIGAIPYAIIYAIVLAIFTG